MVRQRFAKPLYAGSNPVLTSPRTRPRLKSGAVNSSFLARKQQSSARKAPPSVGRGSRVVRTRTKGARPHRGVGFDRRFTWNLLPPTSVGGRYPAFQASLLAKASSGQTRLSPSHGLGAKQTSTKTRPIWQGCRLAQLLVSPDIEGHFGSSGRPKPNLQGHRRASAMGWALGRARLAPRPWLGLWAGRVWHRGHGLGFGQGAFGTEAMVWALGRVLLAPRPWLGLRMSFRRWSGRRPCGAHS